MQDIHKICNSHLFYNAPDFPWDDFSAHEVFIALIMAKKRAKKVYRKVRHEIIKDMCESMSDLDRTKYLFEYSNNFIINKSDTITLSHDSSSEEFFPFMDILNDNPDNAQASKEDTPQDIPTISPCFSNKTISHRKSTPKSSKPHCTPGSTHRSSDFNKTNDSGYKTFHELFDSGANNVSFKFSSSDSNSNCDSNSDSEIDLSDPD